MSSLLPQKVRSGDAIKASTINCILNALEDLQRVSKGLDIYKLSSPTASPRMGAKSSKEPFKVSLICYKAGVFKFNISTGMVQSGLLTYPIKGYNSFFTDVGNTIVSEYDSFAHPCTVGYAPLCISRTLSAGERFGLFYDVGTRKFTADSEECLTYYDCNGNDRGFRYRRNGYLLATIARRKCSTDDAPSFCVVQKWRSDIQYFYTQTEVLVYWNCDEPNGGATS